jgi:hypothetical protein
MYQGNSVIHTLPTMSDLPSEDGSEMGLPDEFHDFQPDLLRETCQPKVEKFFCWGRSRAGESRSITRKSSAVSRKAARVGNRFRVKLAIVVST